MIANVQNELLSLCDSFPQQLRAFTPQQLATKPSTKWSKKEILGHLIDSAKINLQRFVRGQLENNPQIYYMQDDWVAVQDYQNYDHEQLIVLWEAVNRHLAHVISRISEENLSKTCQMKDGQSLTLQFLATDYVGHLKHHIDQLLA